MGLLSTTRVHSARVCDRWFQLVGCHEIQDLLDLLCHQRVSIFQAERALEFLRFGLLRRSWSADCFHESNREQWCWRWRYEDCGLERPEFLGYVLLVVRADELHRVQDEVRKPSWGGDACFYHDEWCVDSAGRVETSQIDNTTVGFLAVIRETD